MDNYPLLWGSLLPCCGYECKFSWGLDNRSPLLSPVPTSSGDGVNSFVAMTLPRQTFPSLCVWKSSLIWDLSRWFAVCWLNCLATRNVFTLRTGHGAAFTGWLSRWHGASIRVYHFGGKHGLLQAFIRLLQAFIRLLQAFLRAWDLLVVRVYSNYMFSSTPCHQGRVNRTLVLVQLQTRRGALTFSEEWGGRWP